jgi:HSP20 family protein
MTSLKSMLPFSGNRNRAVSSRPTDADPFQQFRQDINRMFDTFVQGFGMPGFAMTPGRTAATMITPRIDVSETDDEVKLAAELPGLDESDVEIMLDDAILTIRGTKEVERDEDERDFHIVERSAGVFYRSVVLPFAADPDQVDAMFKDGVLTITIPKPKEAREKSRRIEVKRAANEAGTVDRAAAGDKPAEARAPAPEQPEATQAAR